MFCWKSGPVMSWQLLSLVSISGSDRCLLERQVLQADGNCDECFLSYDAAEVPFRSFLCSNNILYLAGKTRGRWMLDMS